MQRLEVSGAVRPIYGSLGVKRLNVSSGSGMGRHGLDCSGSDYGKAPGTCESGYESSGPTKWREFLD